MNAFDFVDAAGAGIAKLREDGTIGVASPGFVALARGSEGASVIGSLVTTVLPMLPPLDNLPAAIDPGSPIFVHTQPSARGRTLSAACCVVDGARYLIIADRGRRVMAAPDVKRGPRPSVPGDSRPRAAGVRTGQELMQRIGRALAEARTRGETVMVVSVRIASPPTEVDLDGVVLGCVRGVDDVARVERGLYLVLMPDADTRTSASVGKRLVSRIQGYGALSVGIAGSSAGSDVAKLVARAERTCETIRARGGGVLVADELQ